MTSPIARQILLTLSVSPSWFKEGAYIEYRFSSGSIDFLNRTRLSPFFSETTFRWECTGIDGDIARLNVSIAFKGESSTLKSSTLVCVNAENRDTKLLNGTYLGKTSLWKPANPAPNETVSVGGWIATCQGAQKCFWSGGGYDYDTGILLQSHFQGEATIRALNISDPGAFGVTSFAATNIDLGPREWLPEIVMAVPYMLPFIVFAAIFVFVFRRRQRTKRRKKALKSKDKTDSHVMKFVRFASFAS